MRTRRSPERNFDGMRNFFVVRERITEKIGFQRFISRGMNAVLYVLD